MAEKLQFLYQFIPGDRPGLAIGEEAWTEADEVVASAHFAYLKEATQQGIVLLAGRSQDWVGPAIVIIEVDSEAQAVSFMTSDPFIKEGLFKGSLHPFRAALMRQKAA